jgi:hypothetical protein
MNTSDSNIVQKEKKTERGIISAVGARLATVIGAYLNPWAAGTCCERDAVRPRESCVCRQQGIGFGNAAGAGATACDGRRRSEAENGVGICWRLSCEGKQEESGLCLRQSVA